MKEQERVRTNEESISRQIRVGGKGGEENCRGGLREGERREWGEERKRRRGEGKERGGVISV